VIFFLRSPYNEVRGGRVKGDSDPIRKRKRLGKACLKDIIHDGVLPVHLDQRHHLIFTVFKVYRYEPAVAVEDRLMLIKMFLIDHREGNAVV